MQVQLHEGDNRESLRKLIAQGVQVHSVVTDPPYVMESVTKRFGSADAAAALHGTDGAFTRAASRFIGQTWDSNQIAWDKDFWELLLQIMLPGAFCFACGGPRTIHRQIVAMEDAGFIIYPMHAWRYLTGLPKGKLSPRGDGWRFGAGSPKNGFEPIALGMKPLQVKTFAENITSYGVGDLNFGSVTGEDGRYPTTDIEIGYDVGEMIYNPKSNAQDRGGSGHPSVKPIALMQYLIRHITPPGGIVLDPFAGSGTTAVAAQREGFDCILMEAEVEYINFLNGRFNLNEYDLSDLLG